MKTQIKQYAGVLLAATVVVGGIASAAITPIPTISNTFAVAGQVIKSADINKLAEALNILDSRTKWVDVPATDTAPFDINCEYRLGGSMIIYSHVYSDYLYYTNMNINTSNGQGSINEYKIYAADKNTRVRNNKSFTGTSWLANNEIINTGPFYIQKRCD